MSVPRGFPDRTGSNVTSQDDLNLRFAAGGRVGQAPRSPRKAEGRGRQIRKREVLVLSCSLILQASPTKSKTHKSKTYGCLGAICQIS